MAEYRIYCVDRVSYGNHSHIDAVGAIDGSGTVHRFSREEVFERIGAGADEFHVIGPTSGKRSEVTRYRCELCLMQAIRSEADGVPDNNLDNQNPCLGGIITGPS